MASSKADEGKAPRPRSGQAPPRRPARHLRPHVPPADAFEPALEAEFRDESVRAGRRRATPPWPCSSGLGLLFRLDYFHGYRNQDFRPALDWIFPLRAAGTLCIAAAALILRLRPTHYRAVMGAFRPAAARSICCRWR